MAINKTIKIKGSEVIEVTVSDELKVDDVKVLDYKKLLYYLRGLDPSVQIFVSVADEDEDESPALYVFSDILTKSEIDNVAAKLLPDEYCGSDSSFLTFCYKFKDIKDVNMEFLFHLVF